MMDKSILLLVIIIAAASIAGAAMILILFRGRRKKMEEDTDKVPASSKQSGRGTVFLTLFLAAFSLGFGAIGTGIIHSVHVQEKNCSVMTVGRVIDYKTHRSSSSHGGRRRTYSPVVEYRTKQEVITGEAKSGTSSKPFQKGEDVTIGYNPKYPYEFYIKGYDLKIESRLGTVFIIVSIAIPFIAGLLAVLSRIKMDEKKKGKIIITIILLMVFGIFFLIGGPVLTLCTSAGMGLFALYAAYRNKRKKKDD